MMDAGAATNRLRRLHAHLGPAEHGRLGPSCPSTADQRRAIAPTTAAAAENSYWHGHSVNCELPVGAIISPGSSPADSSPADSSPADSSPAMQALRTRLIAPVVFVHLTARLSLGQGAA